MTVPPDITILLIATACFFVAAYLVDRKIQKRKKKHGLKQETIHL